MQAEPASIMVDPLSLSSLILQLIGTIQEIHGVWKLLKGASAEFARAMDRLELIDMILQELSTSEEIKGNPHKIVLWALKRSQKQLEELHLVRTGLQNPAKGFKRRCSKSVNIVLFEDRISNMHDRLQTLLFDLSLALQVAQG